MVGVGAGTRGRKLKDHIFKCKLKAQGELEGGESLYTPKPPTTVMCFLEQDCISPKTAPPTGPPSVCLEALEVPGWANTLLSGKAGIISSLAQSQSWPSYYQL